MGKRKLNALATALVAADQLGPEEVSTLMDYLRGKQPKAVRKVATKKTKPTLVADEQKIQGATA